MREDIAGILVLYWHPLEDSAPAIMEHVQAFRKYSRYHTWAINVHPALGFPKYLNNISFKVIILHYSVFLSMPPIFHHYVEGCSESTVIAFYQDEYQNCRHRFDLIDGLNVDTVYTLLESKDHDIYLKYTKARRVKHTLTGYVDDSLINLAKSITKPEDDRTVDIGYRARPLPYYMGKGAQEKTQIGEEFVRRLSASTLSLDIKTAEYDRIYGHNWYRFLANCRGVIGVEAGVSIFDLDGKAQSACDQYLAKYPDASFNEAHEAVLRPFESNIYYRMLSPRIFEATVFRVCMILFEGRYTKILKPNIHYIPLKKDFSNFAWVMSVFNDPRERQRLTDNAYRDIIDSAKYSYSRFMQEFDGDLSNLGIETDISEKDIERVNTLFKRDEWLRVNLIKAKHKFFWSIPFKKQINVIAKPLLDYYRNNKKTYC